MKANDFRHHHRHHLRHLPFPSAAYSKKFRFAITSSTTILTLLNAKCAKFALLHAVIILSQFRLFSVQQQPIRRRPSSPLTDLDQIPPSIYQWIEENAHICTIVPVNGMPVINFVSVEEGARCSLCPELLPGELPKSACAVELAPNEMDLEIGCHPIPELCVLELRERYEEFFLAGGRIPKGPPGLPPPDDDNNNDIFQVTGDPFDSNAFATTESPTTIRADQFTPDAGSGVQVNISMTELPRGGPVPPNFGRNAIHRPSSILSMNGNNQNTVFPIPPIPIAERGGFRGGIPNDVEDDKNPNDNELKQANCVDQHELCCFWAMAGECDNNPFYMRIDCARTCGTCNCKVRNANKCVSTGIKCESITTTTTTTTTTLPPEVTIAEGDEMETQTSMTSLSSMSPRPRGRPRPPRPPPGRRRGGGNRPPGFRPRITQTTTKSTVSGYAIGGGGYGYARPPGFYETNAVNVTVNGGDGDGDEVNDGGDHDGVFGEKFRIVDERHPGSNDGTVFETIRPQMPGISSSSTEFSGGHLPKETADVVVPSSRSILPSTTRKTCFNFHRLCNFWADMGECERNPFWMRPHCQVACQSCGESVEDVLAPTTRPGCANQHTLCPFWAFIGECARNARWMMPNCRASCQVC